VWHVGRDRVKAIRARFHQLRADASDALDRAQSSEKEIQTLRREVATSIATTGDQIAALSEAVERLERAIAALYSKFDEGETDQ
jgi:hypothetical protein